MWEVWFYAPSGGRRFIDRFHTRSEAEHYKQRLAKLIGKVADLTVCFNQS